MKNFDDDDDDEFWSVAMNGRVDFNLLLQDDSDDFDATSIVRTITTLAPNPSDLPLVLRLGLNSKDGCLSDVSGDVWDAGLLLAAFLYGTNEGRQLCYNACFGDDVAQVDGGGILELGSGLGLSGLAAAAAAAAAALQTRSDVGDERTSRVVLTDRDDTNILELLGKNVESNLSEIGEKNLSMTVQPCDWLHVANWRGNADCCPKGTFNLIIGSALIYVPDHAVACAETLSHYLRRSSQAMAIIIQLPDRAGFDTFVCRCRELGLTVTSRPISEEMMLSVEQKLVSPSDYQMYFIQSLND